MNILGVPVSVSPWTIILALIVFFDARFYIKKMYPGAEAMSYTLATVAAIIIVILSIAAHEIGHALVSVLQGNEIIGAGITGWGAYVQSDVQPGTETAINEIVRAAAGPIMNIVIAFIAGIFVWLLRESLAENTIQYIADVNFRLAIWNLIPLTFIDGGHILNGIVWGLTGSQQVASSVGIVISVIAILFYFFYKPKPGHRGPRQWLETL